MRVLIHAIVKCIGVAVGNSLRERRAGLTTWEKLRHREEMVQGIAKWTQPSLPNEASAVATCPESWWEEGVSGMGSDSHLHARRPEPSE